MPIDDILNPDGSLKSAYQMQKEENERVELGKYYIPDLGSYLSPRGADYSEAPNSGYGVSPAFSPPPLLGPEPPPLGPEPLPGR